MSLCAIKRMTVFLFCLFICHVNRGFIKRRSVGTGQLFWSVGQLCPTKAGPPGQLIFFLSGSDFFLSKLDIENRYHGFCNYWVFGVFYGFQLIVKSLLHVRKRG